MSQGPTDTEAALLRQFRAGAPDAARRLYDRYVRYLTAIATRYTGNADDTADVLQEAFIKIFAALPDFSFRGEGSLKAWVARVVLNEALRFLGQKHRLAIADDDVERLQLPDDDTCTTDDLPADAVYDMIRTLPDGYRTIFNLYVVEEKSHREIATMLGIKENTSASQLHKAKAMLAERIRAYRTQHDLYTI